MTNCSQCNYRFSADDPVPVLCPRCGTELAPHEQDGAWVSIARLSNLAEVGYFADVLEAQGIETQVRQYNDFCAVDGSWEMIFVLRVPSAYGNQAVRAMHDELARTSDEAPIDLRGRPASGFLAAGEPAASPALWKPAVAVVLIAGGLFCTSGHWEKDAAHPAAGDATSLGSALSETHRVLSSDTGPGQPQSRMLTDPGSRTVWLYDDLDGDGRYDRLRCFREGRLVRQIDR